MNRSKKKKKKSGCIKAQNDEKNKTKGLKELFW